MTREEWGLRLFHKSVLKQRKFCEITSLLGSTKNEYCLDIGSDNGIISYLLRKRGGRWKSADLDQQTVSSIRELVGSEVFQIDGIRTPFHDEEFDRVVIVDFLEHIPQDRAFIKELFRITKPGGVLILNVPNVKNSLLRKLRLAVGQTDERHGHLRPGYTIESIRGMLGDSFSVQGFRTYSKFFSELVDTGVRASLDFLKRRKKQSPKGTVMTATDVDQFKTTFQLYSCLYPLLKTFSYLDSLLRFSSGYMLIVKATVNKERPAA